VKCKKDVTTFIQVPKHLYKANPFWTAPLNFLLRNQLNPKRNPVFQYITAAFWVAYDDSGLPIGRISAQINREHLRIHHPTEGHFGFLEANSLETMAELVNTAESWLSNKGMTQMTGPYNLSIYEELGILVDGFDSYPYMMMPYHFKHYKDWMTALGYTKAKDLLAFEYCTDKPTSKKLSRVIEKLSNASPNKDTLILRQLNQSDYNSEFMSSFALFNRAWHQNWGHIDINESCQRYSAKLYKLLIDPRLCISTSLNGTKVGFAYALPNLNDLIVGLKGNLFPLGAIKLIYRYLFHKPQSARLMLAGISPHIQNTYQGARVFMQMIQKLRSNCSKLGIKKMELSWILEDNDSVTKFIMLEKENLNTKRYRIYTKRIPSP
jgi:hypothetical protein